MASAAKRAMAHLRQRRGTVTAAVSCAVGSALTWALILAVLLPLSDVVLSHSGAHPSGDGGIGPLVASYRHHWSAGMLRWAYETFTWLGSDLGALTGLLILMTVLVGVHGALRYAHECLGASAAAGVAAGLRRAVLRHCYQLGTSVFRRAGPAQIVERFTADIEATETGLRTILVEKVRYVAWACASVVVALAIDPLLALLYVVLSALVWYLVRLVESHLDRRTQEAREDGAQQLADLQDTLLGMRLVKSFGMERFQQERFNGRVRRFEQDTCRAARAQALGGPLALLVAAVPLALFAGLAGYNVLQHRLGASAGVALCAALFGLSVCAWRLALLRPVFSHMNTRAESLFKFLGTEPEVAQVAGAKFLPPMKQHIEFDKVRLDSESGQPLLQDVSLSIEPGWKVAVVGMNPAEKRALVNLIPRLIDPTKGEVRIDGEDIRWVTLESLRAQVAVVPRDIVLFNDSVRNNIACGDTSYSLARIAEAAKVAHAHNFVQDLPMGYETVVGMHGERLTPGQQQRIGLARAIARNPAIVIVEEPTEPLDDESQGLIDDCLNRFLPGRTLICIAHRIATIRQATKILCLYEGRVSGFGTHRELTASSELYRHLQYIEFNVFAKSSAT